jgi:hypothetical protein
METNTVYCAHALLLRLPSTMVPFGKLRVNYQLTTSVRDRPYERERRRWIPAFAGMVISFMYLEDRGRK